MQYNIKILPLGNDIETVVQLINQNAKAKHHVEIGIDAEDYYRIKDNSSDKTAFIQWIGMDK